jgi:hypothetical protein
MIEDAFSLRPFKDIFVDSFSAKQSEYFNVVCLSDAMRTRFRLKLVLWIPVRVKYGTVSAVARSMPRLVPAPTGEFRIQLTLEHCTDQPLTLGDPSALIHSGAET